MQKSLNKKEKNANPFENRDLHKRLAWPELSWSSFSQFRDYDKEEWYQRYVLGIRGEPNASMVAGTLIGEQWALDPTFLPEVERPEIFEQELEGKLGKIRLVSHLDGLSLKKKKKLFELKTSLSDKRWTPTTVAKHNQIDFYLTQLWLNYKIKPEDFEIVLIYVPVKESGDFQIVKDNSKPVKVIPTKRSMSDIAKFCVEIRRVYAQMEQFIESKKLSTVDSPSLHTVK